MSKQRLFVGVYVSDPSLVGVYVSDPSLGYQERDLFMANSVFLVK